MTTVSMSYWPADTSVPVAETTVGGILRAAAAAGPQMAAMVGGVPDPAARRRWTFEQLLADAEQAARALTARFAPGERVAAWAPNLPEWVILEFAAGLAGLVLVTVNPAFRPAELEYVLKQSGASGIFLVPEFRSPMAAYLEEVRPEVPALREVVLFTEWEDFLATAPAQAVLPDVTPDDIAQIQYTSGTTGFPKGAELTHRGLTNNARFYAERIALQPGETLVNPMPLFHTAGCGMAVLGALQSLAVHVPVLAFDPALVLELFESERAAVFAGVPTMMIAMLDHPDFERRDLSSPAGRRLRRIAGARRAGAAGRTKPGRPLQHRVRDHRVLSAGHPGQARRLRAGPGRDAGLAHAADGGSGRRPRDRRPGPLRRAGRAMRPRVHGHARLPRRPRRPRRPPSTPTAGTTPETWRPSTAGATCASRAGSRT